MNAPPPPGGGEIRRFIGLVLIVIGALWLAASGLCSAVFFVGMLIDVGDFRELMSIVPMILLFGGVSAGFGFGLYVIGRAMRPKT